MPTYLPVFLLSTTVPKDLMKYRWFKTKDTFIVEIKTKKDYCKIRSHPQISYDDLSGIPRPFVCEDEGLLLTDFS